MRKKILTSTIAVIVFSLVIMTSFNIIISNYKYIEHSKKMLKEYNEMITYFLENNSSNKSDDLKELKAMSGIKNNPELRITYLNKDGVVEYDSHKNHTEMDLHATREEFLNAKKYGHAATVRFSDTMNEETIYYATRLNDGSVIRTSEIINSSVLLQHTDIKYYLAALIISLILGSIIAMRITNSITSPINDLQTIAARISNGDFHKRVKIMSKDELGSLGESFNHMADKLEETLDELISKQTRLTAILKSMGSGLIAIDRYYRIIMINPYARDLFNLLKDEETLKGINLENIINDDVFIDNILCKSTEFEVKLKEYGDKHIRVRTSELVEGNSELGMVIVIEDITQYKILENMRSEFVANVSHELKTPITSIKGFAETLKYVDDSETRDKFLGIIEEESDRLTRLIQDILALYSIEKGENKILENFDVNTIVESVNNLVDADAKKRNVVFEIQGKINTLFVGDKDRFKQMILNLVDNAIKYSGDDTKVILNLKESDENIFIDVIDNGVGISREHLDRVFERFYRVDKARSREKGGTGLGLAIVKHIVNTFNGRIIVTSEISKGTKFSIVLPKKEIL